jgi:uncharacterized membrane protein
MIAAPASRHPNERRVYVLLYLFIACFVSLFTLKSIQLHEVFRTAAYDLGIFDQAAWLASQSEDMFNTVRGMHSWGDHFRPIDLIYAPLYSILPSVNWAFFLQSLSVGMGSIALFHIGRILLPGNLTAPFILSIAFLINPVVHNTLLWQYHSLVMATGPYLFLVLFYLKDKLPHYLVTLIVLLCCREDMPFTLAGFGLVALWQRKWRFAFYTLVVTAAWWLTVTRIVMPHFNGVGYFRSDSGALKQLIDRLSDGNYYWQRFVIDSDARRYGLLVFAPVIFLPLLAPVYLIPALPALLFNVMMGSYNTLIIYHYSVNIVPFVFVASLAGMAAIVRKSNRRWHAAALAVIVLMMTMLSAAHYSELRQGNAVASYRHWRQHATLRETIGQFRSAISPDDGISASDFLLPHLSHRKHIYLFPNPWIVHYWGMDGEHPAHPNNVKFIVIQPSQYASYQRLLSYLENSRIFAEIRRTDGLLIYERLVDEPVSREAAVTAWSQYAAPPELTFSRIRIAGPHPAPPAGPDSHRADTAAPSTDRDLQWNNPPASTTSFLDMDFCALLGCSDNSSAYVYAEVAVAEATQVRLLTGSDDGLVVWHNGEMIFEHPLSRSAVPGDSVTDLTLRPGRNIFHFRVDNASGAWRLYAELKKP